MMTPLLQVALGGALGASGRYLVSHTVVRLLGPGFPWATVAVNVVGSLVMGMLVVALERRGATHMAPFLMTGLLGGFTTFSAFSLDTVTLVERGQMGLAAGYVLGSVVLSILGLWLGLMIARGML